jgi:hypothetical protein
MNQFKILRLYKLKIFDSYLKYMKKFFFYIVKTNNTTIERDIINF